MPIERWTPSRTVTKQEEFLLKRLTRTKKLFGFLRRHRHELFDAAFQDELAAMYRDTGAGREPVNPALMAMAPTFSKTLSRNVISRWVSLSRIPSPMNIWPQISSPVWPLKDSVPVSLPIWPGLRRVWSGRPT